MAGKALPLLLAAGAAFLLLRREEGKLESGTVETNVPGLTYKWSIQSTAKGWEWKVREFQGDIENFLARATGTASSREEGMRLIQQRADELRDCEVQFVIVPTQPQANVDAFLEAIATNKDSVALTATGSMPNIGNTWQLGADELEGIRDMDVGTSFEKEHSQLGSLSITKVCSRA
jgi:hypothetical protein